MSKTPRNAPCPCGSGEKYKKCCIPKKVKTGYDLWDGGPQTPMMCFLCDRSPAAMGMAQIRVRSTVRMICYGLCAQHLNDQPYSAQKVEDLAYDKWVAMEEPTVIINGEKYIAIDHEIHNTEGQDEEQVGDSYVFTSRDPYVGYLLHTQAFLLEIEETMSNWLVLGEAKDLTESPKIIRQAHCQSDETERIQEFLELGYQMTKEKENISYFQKLEHRKVGENVQYTEEMRPIKKATWVVITDPNGIEQNIKKLQEESKFNPFPHPTLVMEFHDETPCLALFWNLDREITIPQQEDLNRQWTIAFQGNPEWVSAFTRFPEEVTDKVNRVNFP